MQKTDERLKITEHIERLEVLSDIYVDMSSKLYSSKSEKDVARLKMELVKKEMLLLTYLIDKDVDLIEE